MLFYNTMIMFSFSFEIKVAHVMFRYTFVVCIYSVAINIFNNIEYCCLDNFELVMVR